MKRVGGWLSVERRCLVEDPKACSRTPGWMTVHEVWAAHDPADLPGQLLAPALAPERHLQHIF